MRTVFFLPSLFLGHRFVALIYNHESIILEVCLRYLSFFEKIVV